MTMLTEDEIAELRKLAAGGEATALEWRAAALAAHPFLIDEVTRARALLRRIERNGRRDPIEDISTCPDCEASAPADYGHGPGCELAALIGKATLPKSADRP